MQTYDSSFFIDQSYFFIDRVELSLIFQPLYCILKRLNDTKNVVSWKSKGLSTGKLTNSTTNDNDLYPSIEQYENSNFYLIFKGSCLKKKKNASFTTPNIIIFFMVYKLDTQSRDLNSVFTLKYSLFGEIQLVKNADPGKYVYSGYGIGFDLRSEFFLPNSSGDKNVIIFGVDMSSSVRIDNKKRDILVSGKRLTQGLDDTTLIAEAQYSINFSR